MGLTVEQVAGHLLCSPSKVSRMETGHRGVTLRDVRDLCDLYGITDQAERNRMMTLAREGKQHAWWQHFDLGYSADYIGLEAEAVAISNFQSSVVPGLLQIAEYTRAVNERAVPRPSPQEIERRIEAGLTRQQILTSADPPSFAVVLDEAVLHRVTGGPQVMRAQLTRLIEAARLPNVTVQVVLFSVGAHPGEESNFKIVELPDPAPAVVFVEGLAGPSYLDKPEDLERYNHTFDILRSLALSTEDTIKFITRFRAELERR